MRNDARDTYSTKLFTNFPTRQSWEPKKKWDNDFQR